MGIRARFRRMVGIFGTVAIVASMATGTALAIGQTSASAASSAFSLDLGTATGIYQDVIGTTPAFSPPGGPTNAGDGWNFTVTGWHVGDTIAIATGTTNGGPGVECNTPEPNGVNSSHLDYSNSVFFSGGMDSGGSGSPYIFATGGSAAPVISTNAITSISNLNRAQTDKCLGTVTGKDPGAGNVELLTFLNSAPSSSTTATVYFGFAVGILGFALDAPVVFDTGFGAATGVVPFAGSYSVGSTVTGAVTIPSDATILGETPSANSPSSGIPRLTGSDVVPATPISNFQISEIGDFLPPNNTGIVGEQTTTPVPSPTSAHPGFVCLVLDNFTDQNLVFNPAGTAGVVFTASPNAGTSGYTAAAGGASVINGGTTLVLPVSEPSNAPTTWTASGIELATAAGDITNADGPVYAYVYYAPNSVGCPLDNLASNSVAPAVAAAPVDERTLGYVQLATVSELANSVYGDTADDTAAQAIGHQFNYSSGECVGNHFPAFLNGGGALFVATDASYEDALGAAYPAGADDSGVALTNPTTLSSATANIIRQEGIQTVYLVGGNLAISDAVENTLAATPSYLCGGVSPRYNVLGAPEDLTVIRIAGYSADDTNELLATFPGAQPIMVGPNVSGAFANPTLYNDTGSGISTTAPTSFGNAGILVTDTTFDDAVSGSALAYAGPAPLITTTPTALSPDALEAIANDHINELIALGGVDAISDAVLNQLSALGVSVLRVAGTDGSDTSTQLAAFELANAVAVSAAGVAIGPDGLGANNNDPLWANFVARTAGIITVPAPFDSVHAHAVLLARGDYYGDAESASVLAIHNGFYGFFNTTFKPLLLTESPTVLGTAVTGFLNSAGLAVSTLPGEAPSGGWSVPFSDGEQINDSSSSVYTIQPVGGIFALTPGLLGTAIAAVTAG